VTTLPRQPFADTQVGGLSALAYDRQRQVFYALSDDRGNLAPPRVYTLDLSWQVDGDGTVTLAPPQITDVTLLRDQTGEPYPANVLDPEGLVLSPRDSWFITSEGVSRYRQSPSAQRIRSRQRNPSHPLPPTRSLPARSRGREPPRGAQQPWARRADPESHRRHG
jgi:hypothetical protein